MLLFASSRRHRGWSEWAITRHFLIRGVFLILLQLLVINRAWGMGPGRFANVYQGVLVALGGGMVSGAFCLRLKPSIVLLLAGGLFVGTELMHPDPSQWGQNFGQPLGLMLAYSGGDGTYWSNYPILPWLELVLFGQLFGHWLLKDPRQAYQRALLLGGAFLLGFIAVRALDGFGNVRPRSGDSWIDFFNVVKYPPAMSFTLLTMGFNLILLWLLSQVAGWRTKLLSPLALFGRSPLFFYTLHLYVYALLGRLFTPSGSSILGMLPYWLLGLIILFPLCHQYASYKQRQPEGSLLRLL